MIEEQGCQKAEKQQQSLILRTEEEANTKAK